MCSSWHSSWSGCFGIWKYDKVNLNIISTTQQFGQICYTVIVIAQPYPSHSASASHPTMHHSEQKCAHVRSWRRTAGHPTGALRDPRNRSIHLASSIVNINIMNISVNIWGIWHQKQTSQARTSKSIPQNTDAITYPRLRHPSPAPKFTHILSIYRGIFLSRK